MIITGIRRSQWHLRRDKPSLCTQKSGVRSTVLPRSLQLVLTSCSIWLLMTLVALNGVLVSKLTRAAGDGGRTG